MITEMVTLKSSVQELEINVNSIKNKVNKQEREMEGMLKKIIDVGTKLETALDAKLVVSTYEKEMKNIKAAVKVSEGKVDNITQMKFVESREEHNDRNARKMNVIVFCWRRVLH